jgi:anthranilate synthase/aminodeoxychorismate synthase-like glutamine amidotransferase
MKLLMIDNYDSFTYNLVQYLGELGAQVDVLRNDAASIEEMRERRVVGLVISPGPGRPESAGLSVAAAGAFARRGTPVLGVCLGHQTVGVAFGGCISQARTIMHGKTSPIHHDQGGVFGGLPTPFDATRYHSLVVEPDSCPQVLEVSARSPDGEIMGLRHRELPVEGVQFHPESILTPEGKRLLANFLSRCRQERPA